MSCRIIPTTCFPAKAVVINPPNNIIPGILPNNEEDD